MEGAPGDPGYVRGSALGLHADGPGAVAPIWRRLLTLIVDWALSVGIAMLLFNYHEGAQDGEFVVIEQQHRDAAVQLPRTRRPGHLRDRKSTRLNSSHLANAYAVFCL